MSAAKRDVISRIKGNKTLHRAVSTIAASAYDRSSGNDALCRSWREAFDMDHVKTAWLNACGASDHTLKSADALFVSDDTAYLVEFKNGEQDNVKKWEIENKVVSSLLMLSDLTELPCSMIRGHLVFVYVIRSREVIHQWLDRKSGRGKNDTSTVEAIHSFVPALYRESLVMRGDEFDRFVDALA